MKKLILLVTLGLVAGVLAGCGSSPTGVQSLGSSPSTYQGTPQERAEVAAAAELHPEFMNDVIYGGDPEPGATKGSGTLAEIDPITFWRRVRVVDRHFEFAVPDTDSTGRAITAIVTVHKELTGTLNILVDDTTGSFGPPVLIKKDISEEWTRSLRFSRVMRHDDDDDDDDDDEDDDRDDDKASHGGHGRWKLSGVSGIEISSVSDSSEGSTNIVSVRIAGGELDTTISDAGEIFPIDDLPTLDPGTEVTVTVTTAAADDIVLLLLSHGRRVRLGANGDDTYTGTFTVPESFGCHHFGVSAISHATLHDDQAEYDAETWILPIQAGDEEGLRATNLFR